MTEELGFPKKKNNYVIPDFEAIECYKQLLPEEKITMKKHFFAGIISAMGVYNYNSYREF